MARSATARTTAVAVFVLAATVALHTAPGAHAWDGSPTAQPTVLAEGGAPDRGAVAVNSLTSPVVGMAVRPDGDGYWEVSADGGVFNLGAAPFLGSAGGHPLAQPVVGMAATPSGGGYWLVASDGGVFSFGDAVFQGSTGAIRLAAPIVGMASTPDGRGYWLVASDGGIFAFGSARFAGSTGGIRLAAPVVGMAATRSGRGYWLVAADGGVFTFGDARFAGAEHGVGIAAIAPTTDGGGYWLADQAGNVASFGDAPSVTGDGSVAPTVGAVRAPGGGLYLVNSGVAPSGQPAHSLTLRPARSGPLSGRLVVLDPGHNGGNGAAASQINQPIFNGRAPEACDTTGAATDSGYTESRFNFDVALDVASDLLAQGATVELTRSTDAGVGPCVTQRAADANDAHADVAVSIHADGGPPGGRGFAVLEPVADGPNDGVIGSSDRLGTDLRDAFVAGTGEPVSDYDGVNGIQSRDDLAGTNLTTVPKVFIECANMRNPADASLLVTDGWQAQAASAIAAGIQAFLGGR